MRREIMQKLIFTQEGKQSKIRKLSQENKILLNFHMIKMSEREDMWPENIICCMKPKITKVYKERQKKKLVDKNKKWEVA